eukprot:8138045-Lingulodinium_polyedra.AAC.1
MQRRAVNLAMRRRKPSRARSVLSSSFISNITNWFANNIDFLTCVASAKKNTYVGRPPHSERPAWS